LLDSSEYLAHPAQLINIDIPPAGIRKVRAVPAAQRAGITVWGVWDADSWINQPGSPDWPLLFDGNFQAKPALQGFKDALVGN
jgi:endo-1,4-beta-xylanase